MRLEIVLEPQEEGGYTVTVPALPGCVSEGESKKEALENSKDAIKGYLKCYHEKIKRENPSAEIVNIAVAV
ncbi:MAG: type II toxin-antitoxin system HicB family antitoxin [Chitinivibrionales bacterium]|nr:type II toxin-antitoxin system HicB family antitoxin [Chitinivibrionales bacterium]